MRYWRHRKLERQGGGAIHKVLLLLLREELILLVGWAAVSRHERIHLVWFGEVITKRKWNWKQIPELKNTRRR